MTVQYQNGIICQEGDLEKEYQTLGLAFGDLLIINSSLVSPTLSYSPLWTAPTTLIRLRLLLVRAESESSGVTRSHPDSSGVTRIRPESLGVVRSRPESTGVVRSRPKSSGVVRSRPESESFRVVLSRSESTGNGVGRSPQEPLGALCL